MTDKANRFEVRSARTGSLEAAYGSFEAAREWALELRCESDEHYIIVDLYLLPVDDRIVWRTPQRTV